MTFTKYRRLNVAVGRPLSHAVSLMAQWRHIKHVFLEKAWRIAQYLIHHLNKLGKFTIIYLKIEFKGKKKSDFAFFMFFSKFKYLLFYSSINSAI